MLGFYFRSLSDFLLIIVLAWHFLPSTLVFFIRLQIKYVYLLIINSETVYHTSSVTFFFSRASLSPFFLIKSWENRSRSNLRFIRYNKHTHNSRRSVSCSGLPIRSTWFVLFITLFQSSDPKVPHTTLHLPSSNSLWPSRHFFYAPSSYRTYNKPPWTDVTPRW
jgi:hypothetical protein